MLTAILLFAGIFSRIRYGVKLVVICENLVCRIVCMLFFHSFVGPYSGSVSKDSTLRDFWYYEPGISSEPGMDFNEINRGWCLGVKPAGWKVVCHPSLEHPSSTG